MNKSLNKLSWFCLGFFSVLPAVGYSSPGTFANQPLWLSDAVKHNIILAVDDSGSMDWETLFDNQNGVVYIGDDGLVTSDSSGNLNTSGDRYSYVFPNGYNGTYDGSMLYDDQAIPPIKAYAFARAAEYNKAYYDPDVTYEPWPSYGGFTFGDVSTSATPVEPTPTGLSTKTFPLFADLNTSVYGSNWGFDIEDSDMACEQADHATCSTGEKHYTYYPGSYYVKDTTSDYKYTPSGGAPVLNTGNSLVLEANEGTLTDPMYTNTDLAGSIVDAGVLSAIADATTGASGGVFVGTDDAKGESLANVPTEGEIELNFKWASTENVKIWFRVYTRGSNTDSFWVNLEDYDRGEVTLGPDSADPGWDLVATEDWNRFWEGLSDTTDDWHWVEWGSVDLTAADHTLNIRRREAGTYVDQILITNQTSHTPSGEITLAAPDDSGTVTRSCATDTSPAHYEDFVRNPGYFSEVDAIAYDGSCLKKYEISGTDSDAFDNGSTDRTGVTVADEKQNFANWFTYYRRRHQAMRGGLASAFQGLGGLQTGIFWINNRSDVTMYDMDDTGATGDVHDFLTDHYTHVRSGGTPLRTALKYAGDQFKRTNTGAPIAEECQKNFGLLFTDGFNTETSIDDIANEDSGAGAPYADSYSDTLGDIAYKYYTENLVPGLPTGKVRVSSSCDDTPLDPSLDCNTNLHMNTYTAALGVKGTIFGETHNDVDDAYETTPVWPDVSSSGDIRQIDDLYHAAVNGRGDIFNANTPQELTAVLTSALQDIVAQIGSGSGVTFNTSSLESNSLIFTTFFNSSTWNGGVVARELDAQTGSVEDGRVWGAHDLLDARDLSTDPRVILSFDGSDGNAFQWASLSTDQKNDLKTGTDGSLEADSEGQRRLSYIRGNMDDVDNAGFRTRASRMGDVVNSTPIFVGTPVSGWPSADPFGVDGNRFTDFKNHTIANGGAKDRTPMIYVGANDGMLHGFNAEESGADAGQEKFAYIPGSVFSTGTNEGLHYLTDPNYTHRYYVDMAPTVRDVYMKTTASGSQDWRTILIGGLRGGGKGLFALDITNPDAISEDGAGVGEITPAEAVLWEFTDADDNDLGDMVTPPTVVMMNNDKWAMVFGNGYNSTNGAAKLFIVYIEEGVDGTWSSGDYVELDTGVGTAADKNGLSGVRAADLDGDGKVDRIYGGDIKGNMWVFDVSGSANQWGSAYKSGSTPKPLFTALNSNGDALPITTIPALTKNSSESDSGNDPNLLVTFGTGQYLVTADVTDTTEQAFFTVWDNGNKELGRTDLAARTLTASGDRITISGSDVDWTTDHGWYFDFTVDTGERMTNAPLLLPDKELGVVAVFTTIIPETSACAGGGSSNLYALPLLTGLAASRAILDLDGDGDIESGSADDDFGRKQGDIFGDLDHLGNRIYSSKGTGGDENEGAEIEEFDEDTDAGAAREGRIGWHEIFDK